MPMQNIEFTKELQRYINDTVTLNDYYLDPAVSSVLDKQANNGLAPRGCELRRCTHHLLSDWIKVQEVINPEFSATFLQSDWSVVEALDTDICKCLHDHYDKVVTVCGHVYDVKSNNVKLFGDHVVFIEDNHVAIFPLAKAKYDELVKLVNIFK